MNNLPARIDPEEAVIGRPTPTARRLVEVSALRWADVVDSADGDGMLTTVRRSKTNPDGEVKDVRFVKDGVARALRLLRAATSPEPGDPCGAAVGADDRVAIHGRSHAPASVLSMRLEPLRQPAAQDCFGDEGHEAAQEQSCGGQEHQGERHLAGGQHRLSDVRP